MLLNLWSFWLSNRLIFLSLQLHLFTWFFLCREFLGRVWGTESQLGLWVKSFKFSLPFFVRLRRLSPSLSFIRPWPKSIHRFVRGQVTFHNTRTWRWIQQCWWRVSFNLLGWFQFRKINVWKGVIAWRFTLNLSFLLIVISYKRFYIL